MNIHPTRRQRVVTEEEDSNPTSEKHLARHGEHINGTILRSPKHSHHALRFSSDEYVSAYVAFCQAGSGVSTEDRRSMIGWGASNRS